MDRKILNHTVMCGANKEEVKIEYVYNYIYDLHSECASILDDVADEAKEFGAAESEYKMYLELAGKSVASGNKDGKLKEYLDAAGKLKAIVKDKKKIIRGLDKKLRLEGIFPLIKGVLEDNGYTGPLLSFGFWDRKVDHGEAWRFANAVINKDNDGKKKAMKK